MIDKLQSLLVTAQLEVPLPNTQASPSNLRVLYNIVLGISGAIAVLIIVIAGFRYITSQGNPQEVATAKNAIIYSLVGLFVVLAAFAIVNFVVQGAS